MLTTCPYFDNLKFDIFVAGGPQCHFVTSVLHAGRFPYVHRHLGGKRFTSFPISTLIPTNYVPRAPLLLQSFVTP